ncbi:MAG TPA: hypothetical protein VFU02_17530 [Polyangiaceae bacterium]|nr:hypothetical protein [Polyangiaceae bacterium]
MNRTFTPVDTSAAPQRAQAHAEIRGRLYDEARLVFPDHHEPGGWDPRQAGNSAARAGAKEDLARGLLDAYALALHVLWTYQEAWSAEGFLTLAQLDTSVTSLLGTIGYQPSPGTAATGLQHFRCVAGAPGILPAGFAVASTGVGEEPSVVYETLHPLRLDPALNELRAFDPASARLAGRSSDPSSTGTSASDVPRLNPASLALGDRLARGNAGDLAARKAARARVEMRRLADTLRQLREAGGEACSGVMDALCEQLCEAQRQAATAGVGAGRMSEAQKLARRRLGKLAAGDVAALDRALERAPGESDEAYRARLDAMARFLDGFVAGLVQDARDQLVLLRGSRTLARLDRAVRADSGLSLGVALPGTDSLILLPTRAGSISVAPLPMLQSGDWLVLAEETERLDAQGKPQKQRTYREAVRVVTTSEDAVPSLGGRATRVRFEPALRRSYRLERVSVLGNLVPVSEGQTVEEQLSLSLDGRTTRLSQGPLTWLPAPRDAGGRRAECRVFIGDQEWTRVDNLAAASDVDRVFAVEPLAHGASQLRFGDGEAGALVPAGELLRVRYRTGIGVHGNRAALRVDSLRDAHPSVSETMNPLPLSGGTEAEDPHAARVMAPAALRAMDRAVSLADLRALALTHSSVARADVRRGPRKGQVQVTVLGSGGKPVADLALLAAFLNARVAPGVRLIVNNAVLVPVFAEIVLRIEPGADVVQVMSDARVRLGVADAPSSSEPGLLHPARVRIDGDLRLSEVYAVLEGIRGLSSCVVRALYRARGASSPLAGSNKLASLVVAEANEVLTWAATLDGREGVALDVEEERDR